MGGTTQTSTSTSQPSNPMVGDTLNKFLTGINTGLDKGGSVFNESLYMPAGDTTNRGWAMGLGAATNPNYAPAVGQATSYNQILSGQGGLQPGMQANINTVNQAGQGYAGLAGAYGNDAPGYSTLRTNALNDAVKGVTGNYLQTPGLLGSRAFANDAATAATNAIAPLDYQNFQNDINNRYRSLDSQAANAGQSFGMQQQGINNSWQAQQMLPFLYDAAQKPANTFMQIGAAQDANNNAWQQGRYDLFNRQNDAGFNNLAKYGSLFGGLAGTGGTTQTNVQPGTPIWQTLLGLGLGGLSLL